MELVGILGYYVLISMILDVFRMSPPEGQPRSRSPNRSTLGGNRLEWPISGNEGPAGPEGSDQAAQRPPYDRAVGLVLVGWAL